VDPTNPSDEVFLELGRLVWAAINLEDVTYPLCRAVQPRHGPSDDVPIGTRIKEARQDLLNRPDDELRTEVDAWLEEAKGALEDRNSVIHSTPIVPFIEGEDGSIRELDPELMHFPRNKADIVRTHPSPSSR
jgi:hypothetical protein